MKTEETLKASDLKEKTHRFHMGQFHIRAGLKYVLVDPGHAYPGDHDFPVFVADKTEHGAPGMRVSILNYPKPPRYRVIPVMTTGGCDTPQALEDELNRLAKEGYRALFHVATAVVMERVKPGEPCR